MVEAPSRSVSLAPAQVQDAVGEDMAALEIAGQLHLVDRDEGCHGLARHGLDRADREARHMRRDLFLAGDQRNIVRTDLLDDTRIDLARQKAQRQADHAAFMRHHALDRVMRLAGVGRSKHRSHAAAAQDHGFVTHVSHPGIVWRRCHPRASPVQQKLHT